MIETRICWSASTNISFRGSTEWEPWDGGAEDFEDFMTKGQHNICEGLALALEGSGFEWWTEVRDVNTG